MMFTVLWHVCVYRVSLLAVHSDGILRQAVSWDSQMLALVDFILFYSEIKASLLALVDLKTSTLYCKYYTHAQILIPTADCWPGCSLWTWGSILWACACAELESYSWLLTRLFSVDLRKYSLALVRTCLVSPAHLPRGYKTLRCSKYPVYTSTLTFSIILKLQ